MRIYILPGLKCNLCPDCTLLVREATPPYHFYFFVLLLFLTRENILRYYFHLVENNIFTFAFCYIKHRENTQRPSPSYPVTTGQLLAENSNNQNRVQHILRELRSGTSTLSQPDYSLSIHTNNQKQAEPLASAF